MLSYLLLREVVRREQFSTIWEIPRQMTMVEDNSKFRELEVSIVKNTVQEGADINDEVLVDTGIINEMGSMQHCDTVGGIPIISQELNRLVESGGIAGQVSGVSPKTDGPGQDINSGSGLVIKSVGPDQHSLPLPPLAARVALSTGPDKKVLRSLADKQYNKWLRVKHLGISGRSDDRYCGKRKGNTVVREGLDKGKRAKTAGNRLHLEKITDGSSKETKGSVSSGVEVTSKWVSPPKDEDVSAGRCSPVRWSQ
ncbi:hypothetical protein LWI29_028657 [Acer saccharum]|uniref:Uncharacterized protein n=1 Tax=Acer saccharum TaxID=4024 RepID=A0AA39REM2_ACESA|nr:hypothetical protein LWI29_028657 [Acer saccharum]